jgi:protein-tyrosine phosphatase
MARAAAGAGIAVIAATPHLRSDFPDVRVNELPERCQALQEALDQQGIPLRIVSGAEVSLLWALEASPEQLKLASYGQRGTDLLIETPDDVSMLDRRLFVVRSMGFRVTLGHPERSQSFQRAPSRLERLVEQGVLLQVNAGALLGRRSGSARLAEHLCREGLAQTIASDAHRGAGWRPVTALKPAVAAVTRLVGRERGEWLARAAPEAIIGGEELPEAPEVASKPRRRRVFG